MGIQWANRRLLRLISSNGLAGVPTKTCWLQRIADQTVDSYIEQVSSELKEIQCRYQLREMDLTHEIARLGQFASEARLNRSYPLPVKAALLPGAAGLGAAARLVAKHGGAKAAAGLGTKLVSRGLWPIVGVVLVAWDLLDHHITVREARPILRRALADHLDELMHRLLDDPVEGIMAVIDDLERQILEGIPKAP